MGTSLYVVVFVHTLWTLLIYLLRLVFLDEFHVYWYGFVMFCSYIKFAVSSYLCRIVFACRVVVERVHKYKVVNIYLTNFKLWKKSFQ
jgi:hypothetical protein